MEGRFGHDFSDVRIHTDVRAADSARAVAAQAYTVGGDIVFGSGQFKPGTAQGAYVLAHELAHATRAKNRRSATQSCIQVGAPGDQAESEAHRAANDALTRPVAGGLSRPRSVTSAGDIAHGMETMRRLSTQDCNAGKITELSAALPVARAMVTKAICVIGGLQTPP